MSSSRSQSVDSSIEGCGVASRPAFSSAVTSSPIASRSSRSKSQTRSPYGAPPDVKPATQISSPPHSIQSLSASRCASLCSSCSPRPRRPGAPPARALALGHGYRTRPARVGGSGAQPAWLAFALTAPATRRCVRSSRSIPGSPDFENRSGRRSRLRAAYAVSLGSTRAPAPSGETIASRCEILPRFATVDTLEIVDAALPPRIHSVAAPASRSQPAHRSRSRTSLRKRCLRRPCHTPLDVPAIAAHPRARYTPAAPTRPAERAAAWPSASAPPPSHPPAGDDVRAAAPRHRVVAGFSHSSYAQTEFLGLLVTLQPPSARHQPAQAARERPVSSRPQPSP